ncbi:hypothetical protein SAMN05216338_1006165 [Bradyrhizobium sp. Rc2d]|uniref:hypothetical protein n=1 Tax=Bradyrhizobium sp. Rc2d TaxID=1855321 RepID=UPI000887F649|nr:hypothetical protein [Bradyrhizobium sp. Rc2d]SDH20506.1 hypothetical protein SAMN05216338_1006165 [Bradyrhizobium sp. Rc2d]
MTADRLRLIASIAFNVISKSPAVLNIAFILPLIHKSLGTALYGEFLSMLALGSSFTLFFGGINTVSRRHLSAAHGSNNKAEESKIISDAVGCAMIAAILSGIVVAAIASRTASAPALVFAALLPIFAAFTNTFDNLRAAYNEHYITAILQTIAQVIVYVWVIYSGLEPGALLASALTLQLPFIVASVLTFLLLLWKRDHLRVVAAPQRIAATFRSAFYVTLSDGALFAALNASLYGLGALGAVGVAAWYGTLIRVFQTLLSPALLIMLPITSFIAIRWVSWTTIQRTKAWRSVAAISFGYGILVSLLFTIGANPYLTALFPDVPRFSAFHLICLAFFFGTVVCQKVYSQFTYSIAEGKSLAVGIFGSVCMGLLTATIGFLRFEPLNALDFLALATGIPLVLVVVSDLVLGNRHQREKPIASGSRP